MKKRNESEKRDLDIVGLIDLVFILLIFFVIMVAVSSGTGDRGRADLDLPRLANSEEPYVLNGIGFRIERVEEEGLDPRPDRIFVLEQFDEAGNVLSFAASLARARRDTALVHEIDWERSGETEAFLRGVVVRYHGDYRERGDVLNEVQISAVTSTPFRLIDAVLTECSELEIPDVSFRTVRR